MKPHDDKQPWVLVTGSSGLIGKRLVNHLAADFPVIGLDVNEPDGSFLGDAWYHCDLTRDESIGEALAKVRTHTSKIASVMHLAAHHDFSGKPSPLYRSLNVEGTRRLIRHLQAFETQQFVFASSLLVMKPAKDTHAGRLTETSPTRAEWDYPRSKLEAEKMLSKDQGKIPVVILRIAGTYDDACNSLPLSRHIRRIYERKIESYVFPGKKSHGLPFVHIDDLVDCFRRAPDRRGELKHYETFLVAEPEVVSYEDLQHRLGELIHGRSWPTIRLPRPLAKAGAWMREKVSGDEEAFIKPWMIDLADDHYPVEIWRARSRIGWEPKHRLWDTLPRMTEELKRDPRSWYDRHDMLFPDDAAVARKPVHEVARR